MNKIFAVSLIFIMIALNSFSQRSMPLSSSSVITHYQLSVGFYTTTVLIFPSAIDTADSGEWNLMAQKQPELKNVLKLKARHKDFAPTNLHVFMTNGRIYAFDISYSAEPAQTTYDLTRLDSANKKDDTIGILEFSKHVTDNEELMRCVEKARRGDPFFSSTARKYQMKLQLQSIYLSGNILLLGFNIANRSDLPYSIDFTRLFFEDKQKVKRSSLQQRDLILVYKDTLTNIDGKTAVRWIIAVPKLTIPDHRQLVLEMYEKNGGRCIKLKVTNRQLFKAKSL